MCRLQFDYMCCRRFLFGGLCSNGLSVLDTSISMLVGGVGKFDLTVCMVRFLVSVVCSRVVSGVGSVLISCRMCVGLGLA